MKNPIAGTAMLMPHPLTRGAILAIEISVSCDERGVIELKYFANGNLAGLRIPAQQTPRRADRLWEHTCFEAFVGNKGAPEYYEFNFSPSAEWAAYAFRGYREGGPIEDEELAPGISVRKTSDTLELDAVIRSGRLPLIQPGTALRLGLSAVIEEIDGSVSYWALKHPAGKPDFHHPDSFALELALPVESA